MSSRQKTIQVVRPAVDEWGIYDPEQAGLAAVIDRLDARKRAALNAHEAASLAKSMRDANRLTDKDRK